MIRTNHLKINVKNIKILYQMFSSRPEHPNLKNNLIKRKDKECLICKIDRPVYLLECAHIKPRKEANIKERNDNSIVNWMCRNCHIIYDKGDISINKSKIIISNRLKFSNKYNHLKNQKICEKEYLFSKKYYDYHFNNIFNKE